MNLHDSLIHALTTYDQKQSTKRGYNVHALAIYLGRLEEIEADIARGATPRAAILAGFSGRLADVCLRAVGEAKASASEADNTALSYTPVKP